jgi:hypothetical protein
LLWDVAWLDTKDWLLHMPSLKHVGIWGVHDFTVDELALLSKSVDVSATDPKSVVRSILDLH